MAVHGSAGSTLYLEDRSGADGRALARAEGDTTFELSPDGTKIAFVVPAPESTLLWSPDSRFLLYRSMLPDSFDVMVAYADEPIAPRKIVDGLMATWSPR